MSFTTDRFICRIDTMDALRDELDRKNKEMFVLSNGFEMHREMIKKQGREDVFSELREAVKRGGLYQEGVDYYNVEDLIQTIIIRLKKGT